ncbi:MAG: type II toxin-antitoxin system MqsA family antitoxin [Magnetococcales bacterium]|nr:type II toxin-antitoxin system MqsA family antitoxin [Magnetococcales bacterium]
MKCVICKTGHTHPSTATITLQRERTVIVIRNVPAEICDDCGEYYLDDATARKVYTAADQGVKRNVEVEIQSYAA